MNATANDQIALEICCNTEWLRENAGLDLTKIDDNYENEAADALRTELFTRLRDLGFETDRAQGQRVLYHGWNGANTFAHKLGPVGTFDRLTKEQEEQIWSVIEAAIAAVESDERFANRNED